MNRTRAASAAARLVAASLVAASFVGVGSAAAACDGSAGNNPAFSSSAATRAVDPCTIRAKVAATRPGGKSAPAPAAADPTPVETDAEGRRVLRFGETEVHVGGYVRTDFTVRGGKGTRN